MGHSSQWFQSSEDDNELQFELEAYSPSPIGNAGNIEAYTSGLSSLLLADFRVRLCLLMITSGCSRGGRPATILSCRGANSRKLRVGIDFVAL